MRKELLTDRDDLFVVHNFLSPAECDSYVARSEAVGYGAATINGPSGPVIHKGMRNNERVMLDDPALAAALWARLTPMVPGRRGTNRHSLGLNERFRF
jgi:hypothetical protein